jgi:predicted nucleic acid-binding protein
MSDLYVDSSVVLRALLKDSPAAQEWFESLRDGDRTLVASRLGELEVRRVAHNAGVPASRVASYVGRFTYMELVDDLIDDALRIAPPVKAADSLHLAAALRLGVQAVDIVTHDLQMASAAQALGFTVCDPVTDDPNRPPVAGPCDPAHTAQEPPE